jgi:signal transduction histidine kinase
MKARKSFWMLLLRVTLIIGAAAAVGLAFWYPLRGEQRSHAQRLTKELARRVQIDISDELRYQMLAQVALARLLTLEPIPARSDWESQATFFMRDHPGYLAVQWVDNGYRLRWMATSSKREGHQDVLDAMDERLVRTLQELRRRSDMTAIFTPAFRLWNGNAGRRIVVPIYREDSFLGFVIAVIDEQEAFSNILSDHAGLGYAAAIREGNEEVYRMPSDNPENEKEWGQEEEVRLLGATWLVRVWPEAEMLREIGSDLPRLDLIMGALIGLLLFMTLDFGRTAYLRSQELQRSRDDLELRVEQRTEELQLTNSKLEAEVHERKEAEESLHELSGRLLNLRDKEQRRIARELHDSTVQLLGALAIDLEKLQQLIPDADGSRAGELLAASMELVERATAELRTISFLLHPPILDDLGLEGVLPWYGAGFSSRSGIQVNVDVQKDLGRFPHELELTLFRILQEALTNVHRHSASSSVNITLFRDVDGVTLQVEDYGRGVPDETLKRLRTAKAVVGVGITGMRERVRQLGGRLEIESDDKGTLIKATLPFERSGAVFEADNPHVNAESRVASSESSVTSREAPGTPLR